MLKIRNERKKEKKEKKKNKQSVQLNYLSFWGKLKRLCDKREVISWIE